MPGDGAGDTPRPVIHRNSLREQIAGALREEMMAGRLAAGRNFTVKEVAELYGVSATPAREALVDLGAQGLLRTEHHRGFTVPELCWDDFLEIFESRVLLTDSFYRQFSTGRALPDLSRLPSLHRRADAAVRAARAGNLDVMVGCDRRFWQEVAGLLGNRRIADYLDWLRVQSWMFAAPYLRELPSLAGVCWDRHLDLVGAIEAHDLAGAHRIVCEYDLDTARLLAGLAGQPLESVAVLGLLTEITGAEQPPVPVEPPSPQPSPEHWPEPSPRHLPEPAPGPGAARGERARRSDELGRELGRELGLGLGLVPQPRSLSYGRFGRRLPEPPPEAPRGRSDPHAAPGR
ncbi:GntR family transcriptional regulator [Streptomyces sp. NRRL S-350]|uniref:GntR family transcriptional regulator n=1 Tax=Streptomyces sp. NRRL S-350 TaxID=1463902 RepID=UPI0007C454BB|nr:GntR family transcriptional regulator [Streptomyces sp. NRRL S-350]